MQTLHQEEIKKLEQSKIMEIDKYQQKYFELLEKSSTKKSTRSPKSLPKPTQETLENS